MQRTRRDSTLAGHVRLALRREEQRTKATASATHPRRPGEHEPMARWENEGGAIGHSAGQRPRPLP